MMKNVSELLSKVGNNRHQKLRGSQQTAIDCQLHVSSYNYSTTDDDENNTKDKKIVTQSRLLVHQDLQHEAIPEEEFPTDDPDDDDGTSASIKKDFMLKQRRKFIIYDEDDVADRHHQQAEKRITDKNVKNENNDNSSSATDDKKDKYHTGTFLYVRPRHDNNASSNSNDDDVGCPCCSSNNISSPLSSISRLSTKKNLDNNNSDKNHHDGHLQGTILCTGDKSAGKTTFAAISSGLSLATQRVLKLHATSLVNTWFDPSEEDLKYFAGEFDDQQQQQENCHHDQDHHHYDNKRKNTSSSSSNRQLPLLPSQLCITSLHGLSEDWDLFLDDDELATEDGTQLVIRENISIGRHDDDDNQQITDHSSSSKGTLLLSSKSNFTTVKIVEVGGDLLDMMTKQQFDTEPEGDVVSSPSSSSSSLLIKSAQHVFATAQSVLYFFDARRLSKGDDNDNRNHYCESAVADFKFFLSQCKKSQHNQDLKSNNNRSLMIVLSRAPTIGKNNNDDDHSETRSYPTEAEIEQMFGIGKSRTDDDENNSASSDLVSFLTSFVQIAKRFVRLKRIFSEESISWFIVPDFSQSNNNDNNDNQVSATNFGHLEDSTMFLLQQALLAQNSSSSSSSLSLFHPLTIVNDARIAQLLFACYRFSTYLVLNTTSAEDKKRLEEDGSSHRFILSIESCTRAIQFAFDDHEHFNNSVVQEEAEKEQGDVFCLSRNFEYCPPVTLAKSVPFLLEILEKVDEQQQQQQHTGPAGSRMLKRVRSGNDDDDNNDVRKLLVISRRDCLALYHFYEKKTLMNGL